MAGCLLFFFFFQVLIKGTLSGKRRALKCCTNPGGSLRTTAASRTARVPLVRRVLEGAARRARRRAQGSALATPGMLRGPSAPARGPNAPDLGPATEPLTQGAPGPHLHVAPKDEPDRSSQSSDYSTKCASLMSGARHQIS